MFIALMLTALIFGFLGWKLFFATLVRAIKEELRAWKIRRDARRKPAPVESKYHIVYTNE